MTPDNDAFHKHPLGGMLRKLMQHGWINKVAIYDDGRYALNWTAKGRRRIAWLTTLQEEVSLGSQEIIAIQIIAQQHPLK